MMVKHEVSASGQQRVGAIVRILRDRYPVVKMPLNHDTPFQLLIATILSAQCTDAMVNKVTRRLFAHFPTAATLAAAPLPELEEILYPTGFFRRKAQSIKETATMIAVQLADQLPRTMDGLLILPGVGRKTANVILGAARIEEWPGWGDDDDGLGVVVDTHVARLARRLGLTGARDPVRIESDLQNLLARKHWPTIALRLVFLGRELCYARKPHCGECPLAEFCPAADYNGQTPWLTEKG